MSPGNVEPTIETLEPRVRAYLEQRLGVPLQAFPAAGIAVCESPARSDERMNRLRMIGVGDAALVTATPEVAAAISPAVESMAVREIFSPLGVAELRRAMGLDDEASLCFGLDYMLTDPSEFRAAGTPHVPAALTKKDIPPEQFESCMSNRRPPDEAEQEDFIWAFACRHDDEKAEATELARFGPRCASIAFVLWKTRDVAGVAVGTEEGFRGRGYGIAVVSAATRYILAQGAVARYGALTTNIPSLRIPRRLGYRFAWQMIWG
jgi:RimJ/RimL family protein N-acetyltransferase